MREIKFRAWDKHTKTMDYYQPAIFDMLMQKKNCKSKTNDFILMQFTGLKDKNGKEIYEGDIVTALDEMIKGELKGSVRYYEKVGWFAIDFWGDKEEHLNFNDLINLEVIGNIYENKELLTQDTNQGE